MATPAHEEVIGGGGTLYKGEDKILRWRIRDRDTDLPVDIAGWTIRFVVRVKDNSTASVLDLPVPVVGTYHATESSNTQYAQVELTDDNTTQVAPKTYRYSLKRTDDTFEDVLRAGDFIMELATQV